MRRETSLSLHKLEMLSLLRHQLSHQMGSILSSYGGAHEAGDVLGGSEDQADAYEQRELLALFRLQASRCQAISPSDIGSILVITLDHFWF